MILQLLLVLAASRLAEAAVGKCPEKSACLILSVCLKNAKLLTTMNLEDLKGFKEKSCGSKTSTTELRIRPISVRTWNFTMIYPDNDVGLQFGDFLTVLANQTDANFKADSDAPKKIPVNRSCLGDSRADLDLCFTVVSPEKKLLDLFNRSSISYLEEAVPVGKTSSVEPRFWKKIHELSPCDSSLILNDCIDKKNCTAPFPKGDSFVCKKGQTLWLKSDNSTWQQLSSIECDRRTKEWRSYDIVLTKFEKIVIRCAVNEPEPWTDSVTGMAVSAKVKEAREKQGDDGSSLLDSPFTWVGIALLGIISIGAVALAIVYAYRKLGKAQKEGDKSGFQPLPQDAAGGSNSEADLGNADQQQPTPTPSIASKTPGTVPPEVSRADGPTADTVNRLSLIKTIAQTPNGSKVSAIPAPPN